MDNVSKNTGTMVNSGWMIDDFYKTAPKDKTEPDGVRVVTGGYAYRLRFAFEDDITYCNIHDEAAGFVVLAGHSIWNPVDKYDAVEGMKLALERALASPPTLLDKEDRASIWQAFWGFSKDFVVKRQKDTELDVIADQTAAYNEAKKLLNIFYSMFPSTR